MRDKKLLGLRGFGYGYQGLSRLRFSVFRRRPMPRFSLRRELLWVIVLKLALLFFIKLAFFPHRLAADEVAKAVAQRIATSQPSVDEIPLKENP